MDVDPRRPPVRLTDDLGRPLVGDETKARIDTAFSILDPGKRGAVLLIMDEQHKLRGHFAAKYGDHWKVAGGVGFPWQGWKPEGWVGVEYAW